MRYLILLALAASQLGAQQMPDSVRKRMADSLAAAVRRGDSAAIAIQAAQRAAAAPRPRVAPRATAVRPRAIDTTADSMYAHAQAQATRLRAVIARINNSQGQKDIARAALAAESLLIKAYEEPPPPPPNAAPVASFTKSVANATRIVSVDASGSTDDKAIASYAWTWGDGSVASSGVTASHTYATTGTYTLALRVLDAEGLASAQTQTVTLIPFDTSGGGEKPPNPPLDTATFDGPSELPRSVPVTTYPTGIRRAVVLGATGNLQTAVDTAKCGDDIILAMGATYAPARYAKPCAANPVAIRPATIPASCASGKRATPAVAVGWPKIVTATNALQPLTAGKGSGGLYVIGVELAAAPNVTVLYDLARLGEPPEAQFTDIPRRIVIDCVYMHGGPGLDIRRGVSLNCGDCAVINSWISGITSVNDAAAIWGYSGPGPFLIRNNYLEATGENIMFGGSDPTVSGIIPSDGTIDRNHIAKPLSWVGVWQNMKNLMEFKSGKRFLVESNVFENLTVSSQPGYAITLSATDQECRAPWSTVSDFVFRWNEVKNVLRVFNLVGWSKTCDGVARSFLTERVNIHDILVGPLAPGLKLGTILQHNVRTVTMNRTTWDGSDYWLSFDGNVKETTLPGLVMTDNLAVTWTPLNIPDGIGALPLYAPGAISTGNVNVTPGTVVPTTPGVSRSVLAAKIAGVVVAP